MKRQIAFVLIIAVAIAIPPVFSWAWEPAPPAPEKNPGHKPQKIVYGPMFGLTDADRVRLHDLTRDIVREVNKTEGSPDPVLLEILTTERNEILKKRSAYFELVRIAVTEKCGEAPTAECAASVAENFPAVVNQ